MVPGAWAAGIAWLVSLGVPAEVTDWLSGLGGKVTGLVALAVVYAVARWVEPRLPAWATYDSTWQGRIRLNAVSSAARCCRKHCAVRRWLETMQ